MLSLQAPISSGHHADNAINSPAAQHTKHLNDVKDGRAVNLVKRAKKTQSTTCSPLKQYDDDPMQPSVFRRQSVSADDFYQGFDVRPSSETEESWIFERNNSIICSDVMGTWLLFTPNKRVDLV